MSLVAKTGLGFACQYVSQTTKPVFPEAVYSSKFRLNNDRWLKLGYNWYMFPEVKYIYAWLVAELNSYLITTQICAKESTLDCWYYLLWMTHTSVGPMFNTLFSFLYKRKFNNAVQVSRLSCNIDFLGTYENVYSATSRYFYESQGQLFVSYQVHYLCIPSPLPFVKLGIFWW